METRVLTPQAIFINPQRLVVPLFQRRYVWSEDKQWEPLWEDVARVAERHLSGAARQPHFLGAVVLQQVPNQAGFMQERMIIDGQQRLTTLQILLDALHGVLARVGAVAPAARLEQLVVNAEPFRTNPDDRFKVWPTNRDRKPFFAVMGALPPVAYGELGFSERLIDAHEYFATCVEEWLRIDGDAGVSARAVAVETAARELLQLVVIDLGVDENAQEIFETLNARGAQLTAADLIKNYVFQQLIDGKADVEAAYDAKWKDFETAFWEEEVGAGRLKHTRSSLFLNHWLIARTGREVVANEVFDDFKTFASESATPMSVLVDEIDRAARVYKKFIEDGLAQGSEIGRLGLFGYRTGELESEVIKPLVLWLYDPNQTPIPALQLQKALDVVESWMVRRMLVRATTKNYNQVVAKLIEILGDRPRGSVGDEIERFLGEQTSESRYWPDDYEVRATLTELAVYRRLGRGRLRMVIEAIEDRLRGWVGDRAGLAEERVVRGKHAIEHVMPRKWDRHWPLEAKDGAEAEREGLIHTLGNLTLLRKRLNSMVSNGPWSGQKGKRSGLEEHDVLFLNRELVKKDGQWRDVWTEADIRSRTLRMIDAIVEIWPVPAGHRVQHVERAGVRRKRKVGVADLISVGMLQPGCKLFGRTRKKQGEVATLLPTGQIDVRGVVYDRPSAAAAAIAGHAMNGWWFFLLESGTTRSLSAVRREYNATVDASDNGEGEAEDDEDEE